MFYCTKKKCGIIPQVTYGPERRTGFLSVGVRFGTAVTLLIGLQASGLSLLYKVGTFPIV